MSNPNSKNRPVTWTSLFLIIIISIFLFFLMEWIFFITKPSFMDSFSFGKKVETLFGSAALVSILGLIAELPLVLLSKVSFLSKFKTTFLKAGAVLPAFTFGSIFLLWFDNFTYTLFRFGIIRTEGILRGVYAAAFVLFSVWFFRIILRNMQSLSFRLESFSVKGKIFLYSTILICVIVPVVLLIPQVPSSDANKILPQVTSKINRPHILWITTDGLSADHMSVYGYERDTTPFLRALSENSLVAENAFTNAANTSGSIISMYTGKYPVTTRVLYPPNILMGSDAYQHFPGLLRTFGYRTVQIAAPHFADAYKLNVLEGFDMANGVDMKQSLVVSKLNDFFPYHLAYFYYETGNRLADRLRHIFYNKKMVNPFDIVFDSAQNFSDKERFNILINEIDTSDQPIFIHVHFMGTHGPMFSPEHRLYSAGKTDPEPRDIDFFDDSILDFDYFVKDIYNFLEVNDLIDQTILVIGSDHGPRWSTIDRVPLLFYFPHKGYSGSVKFNVQNIDIAPTILDYMDIEQPIWMEGDSIINLKTQRAIFSVSPTETVFKTEEGWVLNDEAIAPPFYQFRYATMIYSHKWYNLDLSNGNLTSGEVAGYEGARDQINLPDRDDMILDIAEIFERSGYDTSFLRGLIGN